MADPAPGPQRRSEETIRRADRALSGGKRSQRRGVLAGEARRRRQPARHGARLLRKALRALSQLLLRRTGTREAEEASAECGSSANLSPARTDSAAGTFGKDYARGSSRRRSPSAKSAAVRQWRPYRFGREGVAGRGRRRTMQLVSCRDRPAVHRHGPLRSRHRNPEAFGPRLFRDRYLEAAARRLGSSVPPTLLVGFEEILAGKRARSLSRGLTDSPGVGVQRAGGVAGERCRADAVAAPNR